MRQSIIGCDIGVLCKMLISGDWLITKLKMYSMEELMIIAIIT